MSFRSFNAFNVALLAKQGWRIVTNSDSSFARCLKARYFPRGNFLKAKLGYAPSCTWKSNFLKASWVIKKSGLWTVGNDYSIDIWENNWFPMQNGYKIWTTKPTGTDTSLVHQLIDNEEKYWNHQL